MKKIIFASQNKGKIKEVREILKNSGFEILSLLDFDEIPEIIESGTTFEENAKIKVAEVFNHFNVPAIGDDSGIVVEQLGGRPGVYSARYSGENATDEKNNNKLLEELNEFPKPHKAKFVCSAVFFDGGKFLEAFGEIKGQIIASPRGKNGFGYDPLFLPDGYDITTAELSLEEKNKISHRAKAFNKLKALMLKEGK
jgi:XTP/dITP diphosphohydrolase